MREVEQRIQTLTPEEVPSLKGASRLETARSMWARMRPQIQGLFQQRDARRRRAGLAEEVLTQTRKKHQRDVQQL